MKTMLGLCWLVLASTACATAPAAPPRAGDEAQRRRPGARCDYDDQCGSGMCDAYSCRGPMTETDDPPPGGAALHHDRSDLRLRRGF
jgi:hypothetical protein